MSGDSKNGARILWGALVVILLGTAGAWIGTRWLWPDLVPRKVAAADLPDYGPVADFTLTNQAGRAVGRSDFDGKTWVADFIFTRCSGPCPILTAQMSAIVDSLGARSPVRFVSFSVDPDHDSPETLTAYARRFGADTSRWDFLTGPRRTISDLSLNSFHLGMGDPVPITGDEDDGDFRNAAATPEGGGETFYNIPHSTRFTLIDGNGRIRGYYDGTDPDAVAKLYEDLRIVAGAAGS